MLEKNGLFSVFINMLKACIGGGILVYPHLFYTYGSLLTILFTIFFGAVSFSGCLMYLLLNAKYGKNNNMASLAYFISPSIKIFVDLILIIKCFMVSIAYMLLIRSNINDFCSNPEILSKINNFYQKYKSFFESFFKIMHKNNDVSNDAKISLTENITPKFISNICICFINFLITPLVCAKNIDKLKFTSFIGIIGVMVLFSTSFFIEADNNVNESSKFNPIPYLGFFVFGFTCHQNIFAIQNSSILSNSEFIKTIAAVYITATIIYLSFGFINFSKFNCKSDSILLDWTDGIVKRIAVGVYSMIIAVSIPLQLHPTKNQILEFFKIGMNISEDKIQNKLENKSVINNMTDDIEVNTSNSITDNTTNNISNNINDNTSNNINNIQTDNSIVNTVVINNLDIPVNSKKSSDPKSILLGIFLVIIATAVVICDFITFSDMVKLVSSSFSSLMCFIIPGFYYLCDNWNVKGKIMAFTAIGVGIMCFISLFIKKK